MHLEVLGPESDCAKRDGRRPRVRSSTSTTSDKRQHPELCGVPVLVVEDDAASAKLLFVLLTDEGCNVRVARSAEEALAILQAFLPRVVILDLVLPKMGGLLLAEKLRETPSMRDVVIVAVTSFNGPETEKMVIGAGCTAYVRKPIDTGTFAALVARHLDSDKGEGGA